MARGGSRPPAKQQAKSEVAVHRRQEWSGPLPPPAALQGFEDVVPGSAREIVDEFRAEADHRRARENRMDQAVSLEIFFGQASALIFALAALGVAAFAALHGAQWVASVIGGGVIVGGIIALRRQNGDKR